MNRNSQTNSYIKWGLIIGDVLILNYIWLMCLKHHPQMEGWVMWKVRTSFMMNNIALLIAEYYHSPIIHKRMVTFGDIIKRISFLSLTQMLTAFLLLKILTHRFPCGKTELAIGISFFVILMIVRYVERRIIKLYRGRGRNMRTVLFVGSDPELVNVYDRIMDDATKGYRIVGFYADTEGELASKTGLNRLGTIENLYEAAENDVNNEMADEVYVCISRSQRETIKKVSGICDKKMIHFYYVPVSLETLGMNLKRELLDDIEIFTTYENPLENPVNKLIKRIFDIVLSSVALLCLLPFFPIIWIIIKTQSPGPLFFKQLRTGLDGKEFYCYKFRSMHVNADADKVQATENDPRKYPFGNFMRKMNIDEFPQFWNVLKGDMSIVGPRPHMLAHTEMYSELISKYMVRHFVKPGVTGWAQVTGFRGETKELWQMEGRVKRDIWYMEHWSIWLDIRIMWMTAKSLVIHDKKAY